MRRTAIRLAQLLAAAVLVWVGWGGITAPASELPASLLTIPLFVFGLAWIGILTVVVWRDRS